MPWQVNKRTNLLNEFFYSHADLRRIIKALKACECPFLQFPTQNADVR